MNIAAKKIAVIEEVIATSNENLLDAFLTALKKREEEEKVASNFQPSDDSLNTMANIAENDFGQKKYTSTADFLREMDKW